MKFTNKQALNTTLNASPPPYLPKADSQIRALTVFNPTDNHIELTISIANKTYVKKTVTAGATEVISQLFNQQLTQDVPMVFAGEGLNVLMTVVEITL